MEEYSKRSAPKKLAYPTWLSDKVLLQLIKITPHTQSINILIFYFGVYTTVMWLQRNRPITGAAGSYMTSDGQGSLYLAAFTQSFATKIVATHL